METLKMGMLMSLKEACKFSEGVISELMPFCTKLSIAGLARRERSGPHDKIVFVCLPKEVDSSNDMFGGSYPRVEGFVKTLRKWNVMTGDPETGRYVRCINIGGPTLDFYIANEENWGLTMMMRTGPEMYYREVLVELRRNGYYSSGGYLREIGGNEIVSTPTEESIYKLIGQEWILPLTRIG